MKHLSEQDYKRELYEIKAINADKLRKQKLKEEKKQYRTWHLPETHKVFAVYLFVLFNAILIYSLVAMWVFADLQWLGVLISDIAAQVLVYGIYCLKAYNGKKQEEKIKFERDRAGLSDLLQAGHESQEDVVLRNGVLDTSTYQSGDNTVLPDYYEDTSECAYVSDDIT